MKDAKDLIPWQVTDLALQPYEGFWSFNPSIHFDGSLWRCVLRCCDYAMPDGITIRSKSARAGQQTKNAMVILDPATWLPVQIFKMHEKDGLPRESCPHVGYEDMRIFQTDTGGLQGIAASLHLKRDRRMVEGGLPHQPPEQVLLSFDENYDIVAAHPIRGDGWSGAQKNWVPFDHCAEPRFLYSIDKGTMFGERGTLRGDEARVSPSAGGRIVAPSVTIADRPASPPESLPELSPQDQDQKNDRRGEDQQTRAKPPERRRPMIRGGDVRIVRGGRIKLDAMASRPSSRPSRPSSRATPTRSTDDSVRMMGSGRMLLPKYSGLRGGTQLVRIADDAWLGVGHEMKFVNGKKHYWHVFYLVDSRGKMTAASPPCKLALEGIEFAAGLAIDGDRVVVSFGVDDFAARLGETSLSALLATLVSVEAK